MKKTSMTAATLFAATSFVTTVQAAGGEPPAFSAVDADQSGFISNEEAGQVPGLLERFTQLDANQDGMVTEAEYAALTGGADGGQTQDPATAAPPQGQ